MDERSDLRYGGRLGLQQRVLPRYRAPFFDGLARVCEAGLSVYAGLPRPREAIPQAEGLQVAAYQRGNNLHILHKSFYLCWQSDLMSWLEAWNPDALIMEANPRYLSSRTAIRWMRQRRRPVLGWGLGAPDLAGPLGPLRRSARRSFIRQFDVLLAYSERGAHEYAALGFPEERIKVAYNAVSPPPHELPKRGPISGRPIRLIFVGRLQIRKRVDLLLQACSVLETAPELVIVGDGPERDGLVALARQIFPQAEFVGAKFGDQLQSYLEHADLFILPGTGGLAVQQAMAAGLPVIVAEGDGTQEDLVSGGNGWLVPPGDQAALDTAISEAIGNPDRLRSMGEASFHLAQVRFNIVAMREQFLAALELAGEIA
jgi:glycosyltransferase involved in cell wall biosynthesis